MKTKSDFSANLSKIDLEHKQSINSINLLKMKPVISDKKTKRINPIENLKKKNTEIAEYLKTLKDDKFKKTLELFKLSLSNEEDQEKTSGFKNNMNYGYVGYLLKSDYFAKQEKKDYLTSKNQYPNKKFYFFKPTERKFSLAVNTTTSQTKKKLSNFNDYLYEIDPNVSPNTLGKNIRNFSQCLRKDKDIEKQRRLMDYVGEFVRKEGKDFYNKNMDSEQGFGYNQKEFLRSKTLKKEVSDFYYNLIDFHEKEAEIKEMKSNLVNSFKEYDGDFQRFILDLTKYNDHLRKIDNDKKNFSHESITPKNN